MFVKGLPAFSVVRGLHGIARGERNVTAHLCVPWANGRCMWRGNAIHGAIPQAEGPLGWSVVSAGPLAFPTSTPIPVYYWMMEIFCTHSVGRWTITGLASELTLTWPELTWEIDVSRFLVYCMCSLSHPNLALGSLPQVFISQMKHDIFTDPLSAIETT